MTTAQTVIILVPGASADLDEVLESPRFHETSPCRARLAHDRNELIEAIDDPEIQLVVMDLAAFGPEMLETLAGCRSRRPATAMANVDETEETRSGTTDESERILLIEDESDVREAYRALLEERGYEVFVAGSLESARAVVDAQHATFDLVVADIVLPDGHSIDVVDELRETTPWVEVVFTSGYAPELFIDPEQVRLDRAVFVPKPLDGETLLATVHNLLTGR